MNLRDWQKKASETGRQGLVCLVPRKGVGGITCHEKTLCDCTILELLDSRDAEIDLLLQIIEKQTDTLKFYGDEGNWWANTAEGDSDMICKSDLTKTMDNCGGKRARTTQAEVAKLIEQLKGGQDE
jgi:hypothetical protein